MILINKQDENRPDFPELDPAKYPSIISVLEVDISKDMQALENFRQEVMRFLRNNPAWKRQEIPAKAYLVKEALNKRFKQKNSEFISRLEFDQIANDIGIPPKEHSQLLCNLRALGICLWYDEGELSGFDMILNPGWIANGVYKLINWGQNNRKHILSDDDSKAVFGKDISRYPASKREFLFALMRKFELAFFTDLQQIFVPLLLPKKAPKWLPDFPIQDRLRIQYAANQELPLNTVSRLIVRHHTELRGEAEVWRYGAVLYHGDTTALVRENREGRTVNIYVKGPDKTAYITRLRASMDDIFGSYKSASPELRIEVLVPEAAAGALPVMPGESRPMLPEKTIQSHVAAQEEYFDPDTRKKFSLDETAKSYAIQYNFNIGLESTPANPSVINGHFTHATIEIQDTFTYLQCELNSLAKDLRSKSLVDDADYIENAIKAIDELKLIIDNTPVADLEKTFSTLVSLKIIKDFYNGLTDNNFSLHKNMVKLQNGAQKIQHVLKAYNDVVKITPGLKAFLPTVPDAILDLGKKDFTISAYKDMDDRLRNTVNETLATIGASIIKEEGV
jgi:hypothetical protein